jgi:hypothetical protein
MSKMWAALNPRVLPSAFLDPLVILGQTPAASRPRRFTRVGRSRKGYRRIAGSWVLARALPDAYWREQGLLGFAEPYRSLRDPTRTAGCGPARPVVWGAGVSPAPTRCSTASSSSPRGIASAALQDDAQPPPAAADGRRWVRSNRSKGAACTASLSRSSTPTSSARARGGHRTSTCAGSLRFTSAGTRSRAAPGQSGSCSFTGT